MCLFFFLLPVSLVLDIANHCQVQDRHRTNGELGFIRTHQLKYLTMELKLEGEDEILRDEEPCDSLDLSWSPKTHVLKACLPGRCYWEVRNL
jgi:hypothetical protein